MCNCWDAEHQLNSGDVEGSIEGKCRKVDEATPTPDRASNRRLSNTGGSDCSMKMPARNPWGCLACPWESQQGFRTWGQDGGTQYCPEAPKAPDCTQYNTVFSAGTGGATVIAVDYGYDTHTSDRSGLQCRPCGNKVLSLQWWSAPCVRSAKRVLWRLLHLDCARRRDIMKRITDGIISPEKTDMLDL